MAKRTPSMENLPSLSSDEENDDEQTILFDEEFLIDDSIYPEEDSRKYEKKKHSASFSSVKAFFKRKSSPRKSKVASVPGACTERQGKKVDDSKGIVVTRVFDRNRFAHVSKSLDSYINVPLPPGCIPSEVTVPAGLLQDDVKFDRLLRHNLDGDGSDQATIIMSSSACTVTDSLSSLVMASAFEISAKDPGLTTQMAASASARADYTDNLRSSKGKRHNVARRNAPDTLPLKSNIKTKSKDWRFPPVNTKAQGKPRKSENSPGVELKRGEKQAVRDKRKMDGNVPYVESNPVLSERWVDHCLKLPDSHEETASNPENDAEDRKLHYLALECSGDRRSAICEEIENDKQLAKVNGLKMNLRLFREDLACVKTTDQS